MGISDILLFQERFLDPALNTGLWWCLDYDSVEAVQVNAVCKAMSSTWEDVGLCREFVGQFPFILVAVPPGNAQREIADELLARFGAFVCLPADDAWHGCATVQELRDKGGIRAVERLLLGCRELPVNGLLNISDVQPDEAVSKNRTFSGLPALDRAVGGFSGGELSVWTGKRGEGKSTLLSQFIPEAVARGKRVCVYSGETFTGRQTRPPGRSCTLSAPRPGSRSTDGWTGGCSSRISGRPMPMMRITSSACSNMPRGVGAAVRLLWTMS